MEFITRDKHTVLVDEEDFSLLFPYYHFWKVNEDGYLIRNTSAMDGGRRKGVTVRFHRLVLERAGYDLTFKEVDHRNQNRLDCRKSNLRVSDHSQNQANSKPRSNNTSGYKGVSRNKKGWMAKIRHNGERIHLGTYVTPEEAAKAYNQAAVKYHGEFAWLNPL